MNFTLFLGLFYYQFPFSFVHVELCLKNMHRQLGKDVSGFGLVCLDEAFDLLLVF